MIQYLFLLVGFNFNEKCDEFLLCSGDTFDSE